MIKTQIRFEDNELFQYSLTFEGPWANVEQVKEAFKGAVIPADRKWDNEEKCWLFTEAYLDDVIKIGRAFGDVTVE